MIEGLRGYVGLKGVVDTPVSGLFINSLPGISTRSIDALKDLDYQSIQQAWAEIEEQAILHFHADIDSRVSPYLYRFGTGYTLTQFITDRLSSLALPLMYKIGIEFCKERMFSDRINRYTLLSYEKAQQLLELFEIEYLKFLNNAVTVSLTVNAPIVRKTVLP